jgi:hypothetical protein
MNEIKIRIVEWPLVTLYSLQVSVLAVGRWNVIIPCLSFLTENGNVSKRGLRPPRMKTSSVLCTPLYKITRTFFKILQILWRKNCLEVLLLKNILRKSTDVEKWGKEYKRTKRMRKGKECWVLRVQEFPSISQCFLVKKWHFLCNILEGQFSLFLTFLSSISYIFRVRIRFLCGFVSHCFLK